jgi:FtsP/CotA-like multicopper oxidase with cupredoxin domain
MKHIRKSYPIFFTFLIASSIGLGNTGHVINTAFAQSNTALEHQITLGVREIPVLGGNLYAYEMIEHLVKQQGTNMNPQDITSNYEQGPTVPGPTIRINEGDHVFLTLENLISNPTLTDPLVSVHVHGIHYPITSDGTLEEINKLSDQAVLPGETITYSWDAGAGTVGTWPYHDHTLGLNPVGKDPNGLETSGLFGTLIINDQSGSTDALIEGQPVIVPLDDISKDIVCWISDDAFWCNEIVNQSQGGFEHIALWENPEIKAITGDLVRFHLIGIGTDFSEFQLDGYQWLKPGTDTIIEETLLGPLAEHVFTVAAQEGTSEYRDIIQSHYKSGMFGFFTGDAQDGISDPGQIPGEQV